MMKMMTQIGGFRKVPKFLQESALIALNFVRKVLFSDRNFATFLDQLPLEHKQKKI